MMKKYPKIGQYRNVVKEVKRKAEFIGLDENGDPKYDALRGKPTLLFTGTVKLHGTNSGVVYHKGKVTAQSRNRPLTATSDNHGFAKWVEEHSEWFIKTFEKYLLPSEFPTILFGEWCGKGIQKGVAISQLERMFVAFDIFLDRGEEGHYLHKANLAHFENPDIGVYNKLMFPVYELAIDFDAPEDYQNQLVEITNKVEKQCPVGEHFNAEGIGEGVVWVAYYLGEKLRFKVKGPKHSETKTKNLSLVDIEKINNIKEFVEYSVTENRMAQCFKNYDKPDDELSMKHIGAFLKYSVSDIISEEQDTINRNNIDKKMVGKYLSNAAKGWFINQLQEL